MKGTTNLDTHAQTQNMQSSNHPIPTPSMSSMSNSHLVRMMQGNHQRPSTPTCEAHPPPWFTMNKKSSHNNLKTSNGSLKCEFTPWNLTGRKGKDCLLTIIFQGGELLNFWGPGTWKRPAPNGKGKASIQNPQILVLGVYLKKSNIGLGTCLEIQHPQIRKLTRNASCYINLSDFKYGTNMGNQFFEGYPPNFETFRKYLVKQIMIHLSHLCHADHFLLLMDVLFPYCNARFRTTDRNGWLSPPSSNVDISRWSAWRWTHP